MPAPPRRPTTSRRARAAVVLASAVLAGLVGCSGGEAPADRPTAPRPRDAERLGATTSTAPPSERTAADYEAAGATAAEAACLVAARLDRPLEAELAPEPGGPVTVRLPADDPDASGTSSTGRDPLAVLPATVTSSVEVERAVLAALAADCTGPATREAVAAALGRAEDDDALAEDLPIELERRRATGATDAELACLEAGYRRAPARLSSLAADRRRIDAACIGPARLEVMRRAAIGTGLGQAGATDEERSCLQGDDGDLAVLADTLSRAAGGVGSVPPDDGLDCMSGQRLGEIAVAALARDVDFGGEDLVVEPTGGG